jgi:hypothetical protein
VEPKILVFEPVDGLLPDGCTAIEFLDSPPQGEEHDPYFTPDAHDVDWWDRMRELEGARVVIVVGVNGRIRELNFPAREESAATVLLRDEVLGGMAGIGMKNGVPTEYCMIARIKTLPPAKQHGAASLRTDEAKSSPMGSARSLTIACRQLSNQTTSL